MSVDTRRCLFRTNPRVRRRRAWHGQYRRGPRLRVPLGAVFRGASVRCLEAWARRKQRGRADENRGTVRAVPAAETVARPDGPGLCVPADRQGRCNPDRNTPNVVRRLRDRLGQPIGERLFAKDPMGVEGGPVFQPTTAENTQENQRCETEDGRASRREERSHRAALCFGRKASWSEARSKGVWSGMQGQTTLLHARCRRQSCWVWHLFQTRGMQRSRRHRRLRKAVFRWIQAMDSWRRGQVLLLHSDGNSA